MNKLPKKLTRNKFFLLALFLLFSSFSLGFSVSNIKAQVPEPYVSCDDEPVSPEFHSLRPYQSSPCDREISETALFCGNNLVLQEEVSANEEDCVPMLDGKLECTVTNSREIAIDLSDAELPIVGNTDDVLNSQSDSDLNDAEKTNEYVSWYLNGVINRAEYSFLDPLDNEDISKIVDFSGPLKKLLPWDEQIRSRIKTIERAIGEDINEDDKTEVRDRHDQVVACTFSIPIKLFRFWEIARVVQIPIPCYSQGIASFFADIYDLKDEKRLSEWKNHLPPLIGDYTSPVDYQIAYKRWRGERCAVAEVPSFIPVVGGKKFFYCFDDPTKPNYWANLFPYIPFSSTDTHIPFSSMEDRVGSVEIETDGIQLVSEEAEITNVSFLGQGTAELFFAHMEETTELARMLQQTFASKDSDLDSLATTNVSPLKSAGCDLTHIRTNSGDDLFAGEIAGTLTYTAKFTCDSSGSNACEQAGGKCYDRSCLSVNQVPVNGGSGCDSLGQVCCTGGEKCSKNVLVNLSLITKTPKADELWSRTVAGASAIFKRIFPKVGPGGAILGILDIPAATKVSYSGEEVLAGNPEGERSGESAELYFPHIGGVSEYFLKGIQTILRPKGFGEQIISGQASSSVACGQGIPELPSSKSSCSACPDSYINLPPSMREIFESAGSYYNVPASVLFAIFYNEGSWDRYDWSEDLVINSSGPNCEVPNCSSYSSVSGATGPFSFIPVYWEGYGNAVLEAGINDGREPNICNLLDTAFAAAKKLAKERGGSTYGDPICAGVTLNQLKGPSSSCGWSDADIVTAARQYLGYCEDPEHPDPVYKPRPSCVSNPITCYQKNVLEVSRCRY